MAHKETRKWYPLNPCQLTPFWPPDFSAYVFWQQGCQMPLIWRNSPNHYSCTVFSQSKICLLKMKHSQFSWRMWISPWPFGPKFLFQHRIFRWKKLKPWKRLGSWIRVRFKFPWTLILRVNYSSFNSTVTRNSNFFHFNQRRIISIST